MGNKVPRYARIIVFLLWGKYTSLVNWAKSSVVSAEFSASNRLLKDGNEMADNGREEYIWIFN